MGKPKPGTRNSKLETQNLLSEKIYVYTPFPAPIVLKNIDSDKRHCKAETVPVRRVFVVHAEEFSFFATVIKRDLKVFFMNKSMPLDRYGTGCANKSQDNNG
jgi:hypothetical protein